MASTYVICGCLAIILLSCRDVSLAAAGTATRRFRADAVRALIPEAGDGASRRQATAARAADVRSHRAAQLTIEVFERV